MPNAAEEIRQPVILCVDDDPRVLRALQRTLVRVGCRVILATDGYSALKILADDHIEVLICDEAMPGVRGVEVLAQAKLISPETARVLLTAHCGNQQVVIRAVNQSEIFRILSKPWEEEEIVTVIGEALGMSPQEWRERQARIQARLPQRVENGELWVG